MHKSKVDKPFETKWTTLEAVFKVDPDVNVLSLNFSLRASKVSFLWTTWC